ncbi:hypothetical protein [Rhodoflexus caldus]|uniref:hypothetical protein n=1 Tax=Rhodoflexus caldus TaxID=2891236 RepID=UPI00202AA34E|nr:hypothetical protein [Rhodoflexus caldus]
MPLLVFHHITAIQFSLLLYYSPNFNSDEKNLLVLAVFVGLSFAAQAQNDGKSPNVGDKKEINAEESEQLNQLAMAQSLAVYGKKNNLVEALVLAAKMLRQMPGYDKLAAEKKPKAKE